MSPDTVGKFIMKNILLYARAEQNSSVLISDSHLFIRCYNFILKLKVEVL